MKYNKITNQKGFGALEFMLVMIVLAIVGGLGWYVWSSRVNDSEQNGQPSSQAIDQPEVAAETSTESLSGEFEGVDPKTGSGSVTLEKEGDSYVVRLGDNFNVQEGPDLYVGFSNNGEIDQTTLFAELTSFSGSQDYTVPQSIDISKYDQIMIYCKEFTVPFAVAQLSDT